MRIVKWWNSCGCMEIDPVNYGECVIPIIAVSHSIFTHTHIGAHATCCNLRTLLACTEDWESGSLLQWVLLRCMPCDAHSACLLYTAQWTSNTHAHSLRLNSHLLRIINSVSVPQCAIEVQAKQFRVQGPKTTYCFFLSFLVGGIKLHPVTQNGLSTCWRSCH